MIIYVAIPMEEGINRGIAAYRTEESAKKQEVDWLRSAGITTESERERASDWGTGFAIWEMQLEA